MRRLVAAAVLASAACGPAPPPQPIAPVPRDLVALAADPETGAVGRLEVSNAAGGVELVAAGESTTIAGTQAPGPVVVLTDADIQGLFGEALSALPPAALRFNLYFEFGSDTLTPASEALIAAIVSAMRGRPAPEVTVIGHTDTTGAADVNRALGLSRASLVRDRLVAAGLDRSSIELASHGESDLLVATPDDTAEPLNRRVEVSVR